MAENAPVEPEEQVDLDGDNEIEEMLDEDIEEALEEDSQEEVKITVEDKHGEEEQVSKGEEHEKTLVADGADDPDSPMRDQEKLPAPKDEGSEKRAELLALPPHGSEIFIGGLPRDTAEDDLRGLCEPIGGIAEIRLAKDKDTGDNKGHAFITFKTKESAQQAIEDVHNKEFKGKTLRCSLSQVKHRLFIGNIPKSWTEEDFRRVIEENGPGVENIELLKDPANQGRNRGFAFVEYYNHACADYAREKMSGTDFKLEDNTPTIRWAEPKNAPDPAALAQVKALYVKNLPDNTTPEQLKELFQCHGEVTKVVLPPGKLGQNKRDFGYIHFAERSSALKAVKETEKYEIDGHVLEVFLAKPHERKLDTASNFYNGGSVPHSGYGFGGDPYGAYGAARYGQPMIYGRGPMPAGMQMVPMVLPDGRIGYVLQPPGARASSPPPARRSDRGSGSSGREGRGDDNRDRRRYRPY
ncbi:heterogeneous nuclear ribonucleoprotein Q-like [Tasmannia lanceolata]|uniref:heterogeneous nuclear ribonucleoprotein Q-like n=1 Tax=Tasmannia lanceolata TaxID=3420 RepID=UPI0040636EBC